MDGLSELLAEGWTTLYVDLLLHRGFYHHVLLNRIEIITRNDIRRLPGYVQYENTDARVKYKGQRGLGDEGKRFEAANRFVCELNSAWLLGPVGPALTSEGKIIAETVAPPPLVKRRVGVGLARSMDKNGIRQTLDALSSNIRPNCQFETAAFAVPSWRNYYHWTVECLIRARLLERHGEATGKYPTLLVPEDRPRWMDETLNLLDYSGPVAGLDSCIAAVDTLVVPTFPDPTPAECCWLRERMRTGAGVNGGSSQERVFIARDDATVRRISNQDAVKRVLDRHDIDIYLLNELSVREQVELFSKAEFVVAPHGAGLTNIIYGEELAVVELFGEKTVGTFDRIAENMGHNYRYLICEQDGVDIFVSPDKLDQAINQMLE
jgi:hypothetical protein